ncbi:hypothetical protein GT347_20250 [Xylophilus rhododendri]|uniref:Phage head morphogenesis domain-containing protein n=1 Tax=Xylophilus rhododendri TaxID=2697032 RepID=A0A857J810_9BURK|nr:phage minor head protein [Xylophilus rhododendri]QHJ00105.1 hypothetical protein GT347_20250 [Xylophilus rhododendri]
MAETVNERLRDAAISHEVDLRQYSASVVHKIIAVLNRSDERLFEQLTAALAQVEPSTFAVDRLESLLGSVRATNVQAYNQVERDLTAELRDFAGYEVDFQSTTLRDVMPQPVPVAVVSVDQVYAAAMARPFQGGLLKQWIADQKAGKAKKIRQVVAQGFVEGRTTDQIVRDLRGTRAKGYADGLLEISRRDAQSVVQTALGHMAGFVQDRVAEANEDIIKAVRWSATLDLRTSPICRVRDGKTYTPAGHKPIGHTLPWLAGPGRAHWRCRSAQAIVTKSWQELSGVPGIPEFTPSQRASMDGQVPAETTYPQWLAKQSAARQDQVLGPARAKLLRDGGLELKDLYGAKGQPLTLDQLRERDAAAFSKAGI